jgi:acetoin utilization protein AcuB
MTNTEEAVDVIMTKTIITVKPDDTCLKVQEIFSENPIHHILVIENSEVLGIISNNDMLKMYKEFYAKRDHETLASITAGEIMTANPLTINIDDSIGLAADIILANKLHALPVMDGDELAGILTNHDILKFCFK